MTHCKKHYKNYEINILGFFFTYYIYKFQKNKKVENLFEDIKNGVYLLSLLEALSGEKLVSSAFLESDNPIMSYHISKFNIMIDDTYS